LCCATWLREFAPVSIKMAKSQDLPLNASEVSGVCGRLLCCLAYENDFYTEARKQMPRVNSIVETPQGPGKVRQVHVLANSISVLVEGPNDARALVDVPVPEPVFELGMKPRGSAGEPARRLASEPGDTDAADERLAEGQEPARATAQEMSGHIGDAPAGSSKRSRSRQRKR
jgi:hypothetical protein